MAAIPSPFIVPAGASGIQTITIPISTTTTGALYCNGSVLCGLLLPATFTGATISFLASMDSANFKVLKSSTSGTTLTYTVTQDTFSAIDPKDFQGVNWLKIVSASTEGAARDIVCFLRGSAV